MSDLTAFLELLSWIEEGWRWVEEGRKVGDGGGEGRSVLQASQQR